jgi:hypothetical protein
MKIMIIKNNMNNYNSNYNIKNILLIILMIFIEISIKNNKFSSDNDDNYKNHI